MTTRAYSMINAHPKRIAEVVETLRSHGVVVNADVVTGPYDIIAAVEAEDFEAIRLWLQKEVQTLDGVQQTLTGFVL